MLLEGCYDYILVTDQIVKDQHNCGHTGHLLTSYPMQSISFHLVWMLIWVVLINILC